ncbi:MAG: hypothetical protein GWO16_00590 [Gammaproteobacteria bacterium]|nr:hypothetical protein [Gammaproteobacteria bacterium]NIR97342.1 hypothetical protein [Gammaproteobacteria bacterium]NIT63211.1 hypothetical protein [Gammaproteobacteria bacterium]NIV19968.1 hypothetical protein [Gammaproteobacteria bacterium]NIY31791.1 hypothetical protein [Gammaproteobacteria bacterium]
MHLDEYLKVYDDLAQALDALLDNAAHATTPLDRAAQDNGSEEPSEPLIRPKAKPAS